MTENIGNNGDLWGRRVKFVLIGFALVGGFFLIAEHRAHVLPWLPWLFLAACPLMHVFMHHGHGDHDQHGGHGGADGHADTSVGPGSAAPPSMGSAGSDNSTHRHHGDRS